MTRRLRFVAKGRRARRDDGMVTAEAAVALPVLVLVAVFAVAVVLAAGQRTRLVDAAHVVALAAARGDPDATALAARIAPGAQVAVTTADDTVTVTVRQTLAVGPVHGPSVTVTAVAPLEPDPAADAGAGAAVDPTAGRAAADPIVGPTRAPATAVTSVGPP